MACLLDWITHLTKMMTSTSATVIWTHMIYFDFSAVAPSHLEEDISWSQFIYTTLLLWHRPSWWQITNQLTDFLFLTSYYLSFDNTYLEIGMYSKSLNYTIFGFKNNLSTFQSWQICNVLVFSVHFSRNLLWALEPFKNSCFLNQCCSWTCCNVW